MPPPLGKISKDVFKKTLSGNKSYLPQKVSRELKAAKMSRLLYSGASKQQAIKAIKHLQGKSTISKLRSPSQLWQKADREQRDLNQAKADTKRQKHVRVNIEIDNLRERDQEAAGKSPKYYQPKSALGRYLAQEITEETQKRQQQANDELEKRKQMFSQKLPTQKKPPMASLDKLKDLEID
ncbi:MAG TPA: hypothetical protein VJG65_00245 [Patescibacteria group bacterium]|nr:hypothetical protein [Patescibacteria group bacterium]